MNEVKRKEVFIKNLNFIDELNYKQLIELEKIIENMIREFYNLNYIYVINDKEGIIHFCKIDNGSNLEQSNFNNIYLDIFTELEVTRKYMFEKVLTLEDYLTKNNIEHDKHYKKEELKQILNKINEDSYKIK